MKTPLSVLQDGAADACASSGPSKSGESFKTENERAVYAVSDDLRARLCGALNRLAAVSDHPARAGAFALRDELLELRPGVVMTPEEARAVLVASMGGLAASAVIRALGAKEVSRG